MSLLEQFAAKAQVTGDLGDKLDKDLENSQAEVHRLQGGYLYLKECAQKLASVAENIRKDFEEGKFESKDAKSIHDLLLDYNRKAIECVLNFSELKKSEGLAASGKMVGIKESLQLVKKHHLAATARASQITQAIESDEQPIDEQKAKESRKSRSIGEHPGQSSLDERRAEAMKDKKEVIDLPIIKQEQSKRVTLKKKTNA